MGSSVRRPLAGRLIVLAAIILFSLSLRGAVTSLTPLLQRISDEIGFGTAVIGVFGMLPTAMFGVAGFVAPPLIRRIGLERAALAAVIATTVGVAARAAASGVPGLLALSCLALLGMGVGNVVIPPLVKRYFNDRVALLSSAYLTCLQVGTMIPALLAVPVADAAGWRISLAVWALVPLAAVLPWVSVVLSRRGTAETAADAEPAHLRGVWRSPIAVGLALMFGVTSLNTYAMFTWLPSIITSAGGSEALGGSMVALFPATNLLTSLVTPAITTRLRNPFPVVAACILGSLVGYAGLLWWPLTGTVVWVAILGLAATTFPMSLVLINLRTRTGAGSAALSGFVQGVGYATACTGPLLLGVLHDASHGWAVPFGFLLLTLIGLGVGGWMACKPRHLEDTIRPRRGDSAGSI